MSDIQTVSAWPLDLSSIMRVTCWLAIFVAQDLAFAASNRTIPTTPTLLQGDIAVPEGQELSEFFARPSVLWPQGIVYYWIETGGLEGEEELPVFTNAGLKNINQAFNRITEAVPCIEFRWAISFSDNKFWHFRRNNINWEWPMSVPTFTQPSCCICQTLQACCIHTWDLVLWTL